MDNGKRREILKTAVAFWTLILMAVSRGRCFRPQLETYSNVLLESQEAISSVLQDSWIPGCSLVYVTDGSTSSATLRKFFAESGLEFCAGVFEVTSEDRGNNASFTQHFDFLDQINEIRKSSWCLTMVVAIDKDDDFLSVVVEEAVSNDVLIWPTRLLVVTRLPGSGLRRLRESLSAVNAVVLVLQGTTSTTKRCGVYMYLPYSHRGVLVASWTPNSGLIYLTGHKLFPDKFRKLSDSANLTVVGQNFPPHVIVRKLLGAGERGAGGDGVPDVVFSGPLLMLLDMLATNMNFTYSLVQPSDGSWGYLFPNGTWNGMVGMLLRKDVDFALGPFGITYIRSKVIDYTNPLVVDYGRILGRRGDTEVDPWSFAMPLSPFVWAGIFATLIFILAFVGVTSRIGWDVEKVSPKISVATYVRTFLQQDIVVPSDNDWERLMLGFWMLTTFILIKSYSTNLMSLLAVRYISEPYQSVRAMLDDPKVTMLWFANTAHIQYLSAVDSGIFHEVAEAGKEGRIRLITPSEYAPMVDRFVGRGDHVMINPFLIMKMFLTEDYMDNGNCKFYVSRERFLPLTFCMVVQKYSPLRTPINEGIRAVVEGGIYNYWLDNAISNSRSCKNPPTRITVKAALSLTNIWGMFVVLAAGYIISTCALCLEIIHKKLCLFSKTAS